MITYTPKKDSTPADLDLDLTQFRRFKPSVSENVDYEGYIDETEGLIIRTFKGTIDEMVYLPISSDRSKCPSYYEDLEGFVRVMS